MREDQGRILEIRLIILLEDVLGIIRIQKAIKYNLRLITIQLQQEHQHYAVMVHIVSAGIEEVLAPIMVVWQDGYENSYKFINHIQNGNKSSLHRLDRRSGS